MAEKRKLNSLIDSNDDCEEKARNHKTLRSSYVGESESEFLSQENNSPADYEESGNSYSEYSNYSLKLMVSFLWKQTFCK